MNINNGIQHFWVLLCVISISSISSGEVPVGRFVNPRPVYDDNFEASNPSVSDDGLTLYFASSDLGGSGVDIFHNLTADPGGYAS